MEEEQKPDEKKLKLGEENLKRPGNLELNREDCSVMVSVNPKIYPLDVVMSAAYIFTNDNYVLLDGDPNDKIIVEIRPKDKTVSVESLGRMFNNELINYATYAVQAIKNAKLRETILNRVLLTNSVQEIDSPIEDPEDELCEDDPEDIAIPWEEKYGDKDPEEETSEDEDPDPESDDQEETSALWEEKYGKDIEEKEEATPSEDEPSGEPLTEDKKPEEKEEKSEEPEVEMVESDKQGHIDTDEIEERKYPDSGSKPWADSQIEKYSKLKRQY